MSRLWGAWAEDGLARYRWSEPGRGGMASWQQAFHQDGARLRAIIKGNQVGGSRCAAAESWWAATGTHPWREIPRREGLAWICVANWGRGYEQVARNLMATCPKALVDWGQTVYVEDRDRFVNDQIVLKDGFVIRFVPSGGGSKNASAGTLDWLWIDEPPARAKWGELIARCNRWESPIWLDLTPWDAEQDLGWLQIELEGDPERGTPPRAPWSVHKILFLPAYLPWMDPEGVLRIRAATPAAEAPMRLDANWEGAAEGRFFAAYGPPFDELPASEPEGAPWQICAGADYGEGAGKTACPISAQRRRPDGKPEIRFLAEYVSTGASTVTDDALGIRAALEGIGLSPSQVARWWGDTNTLGKASPGHRVNAALGTALGVRGIQDADKRPGAPDTGWRLLAQAIGLGLVAVDAARCPRLDRALKRWKGREDEHKHILDGARYQTYELLVDTLGREGGEQGSARIY